MNIEKELRDALLAMSEVTDIVVARIWDEWFRTDVVPAIVYEFDSEGMENDLAGKGGKVIGDINLICRAETRAASRDLAYAVRLNGTGTPISYLTTRPGMPVTERDEDPITMRPSHSAGTGLAGYTSDTFNATLLSQQAAAIPKRLGSNDHWYDTYMNFELQWYEGR